MALFIFSAPEWYHKMGWESVRWLVIGITLPKIREIDKISFHVFWSKPNSYSRFWRNSAGKMNLKKFLVFDFSSFHHVIIFWNQKRKTKRRFANNKKQLVVMYTGLPTILRFSDYQISKIHIFQGCSHIFLVFCEVIYDNREGYGSRFWQNFGSSRIIPKVVESIRNR